MGEGTQEPGMKWSLRWLPSLRAACPSIHSAGKAAVPRLSAHATRMPTASQLHREARGVGAETGRN